MRPSWGWGGNLTGRGGFPSGPYRLYCIIFQHAGDPRDPSLGGLGGDIRRVGDCGGETIPTLLSRK